MKMDNIITKKSNNNDYNDFISNKLKKEVLSILSHFDDMCKKNNLKYFITGGTLLGSARHKGFIPWDDDIDVAMPIEDYYKFLSIAANLSDYKLISYFNKDGYQNIFSKIIKNNTLIVEKDNKVYYKHAIGIDIFPLFNYYDDFKAYYTIWIKLLKKAMQLISHKDGKLFYNSNLKKFLLRFVNKNFLKMFVEKTFNHLNSIEGNNYINYGSKYPLKNQIYKKSAFGKGHLQSFENCLFNAPDDVHYVLNKYYGDNYMEIPPKDKWVSHSYSKIIFSDGTVYEKK